jgi:resuscitation-promoting factor RpfB
VRRSIKYGLYAAVLAGVLGSTVAWVSVDKAVTLDVDGQTSRIHTVASTVGDALAGSGYHVGAHDIVAPAPNAAIHNGSTIVLERGRLLRLTVDGIERNIWVTAPTISQALADLGYESADLTTVSRSKRLPLTPTDIDLSTMKIVTLVQGGEVSTIDTTDALVGDLLNDLGIEVGPKDIVTPSPTSQIVSGEQIVLERVTTGQKSTQKALPFTVKRIADPTLPKGTTQVVTSGKSGAARIIYAVVYVDGVATGQTIVSSTTIVAPTVEVVKVGTKPAAPPVVIVVDPGSAQAIAQQMLLAKGMGSDQFSCLVQLWDHESGWRVNADNPSTGAYGIPQALPGDKMAVDGADWQTNPATQITWGLNYIDGRYTNPCGAWSFWQANDWY